MTKKNRRGLAIAVQGHLKPLCGDNNPLPPRLGFRLVALLSTETGLFRGQFLSSWPKLPREPLSWPLLSRSS